MEEKNKDYLFTKENAKEMGRKAGLRSGEVRRKNRELKDIARTIMSMPIKAGEIEDFDCVEGAKGKNLTPTHQVFLVMLSKALKGDKQAAEFCFDKAGLNPAKEIEVNADVNHTDEITNILGILSDYKENGGKYSPSADKKDRKEDEDDK